MKEEKYRMVRHRFVSLLLSCVICSCGGGTIGTGILPSRSGVELLGGGRATDAIACTLRLTVRNSVGSVRAHAHVTLQSGDREFSGVTNSRGYLSFPVALTSGEPARITVQDGTKTYSTEEYVSPAGSSSLDRTLILQPGGKLIIKE